MALLGAKMSKGLGRIAQSIYATLNQPKRHTYTTSELCRVVYNIKEVKKKHRVAVLRALRTLAKRNLVPIWYRIPKYEQADLEWFNRNVVGKPSHSAPLDGRATNRK